MKNSLYAIILTIFSFQSFATEIDDMYIYSKVDQSAWNIFLIDELEVALENFGVGFNPKKYVYKDESIIYDNNNVNDFTTPDSNRFLKNLENISGLSILDIKPELALNNFGYEIKKASPVIKLDNIGEQGISFDTSLVVDGLDIFADSIDINFVLPQLVSSEKIVVLKVRINDPLISFKPGYAIPMDLKLNLFKGYDTYQLFFPPTRMDKLANSLSDSLHAFDFSFSDLEISDVSLEIMGRVISVEKEQLKGAITDHKDDLKEMIVNQLAELIRKDGVKALLSMVDGLEFPATHWFNGHNKNSIPFYLDFKSVRAHSEDEIILALNGEFCSRVGYVEREEDCVHNRKVLPKENMTDEEQLEKSKENIRKIMKRNNFVASISENYFNDLMATLIEDGQFDEIIDEIGIELGPQNAFIKFDEKGRSAKAYIDVKYYVGKLKGWVIKQRKVRFPVVLELDVKIEYREVLEPTEEEEQYRGQSLPHIVFTVTDVLLEDKVLRYGFPEYDMPSTVKYVRYGFRNRVIAEIRKELFDYDAETNTHGFTKWKGVELPALLMPKLHKLKLEKLIFQNDGQGRGNFIFPDKNIITR